MKLTNSPQITLAIAGVSRDCFPVELTDRRLTNLVRACDEQNVEIKRISTIIENENDALKALDEAKELDANAVVIYLGNFGPEGPTTIFAKKFDGPVMLCAAAEESGSDLINGRGDAFCGLLNASYNTGLRNLQAYIPDMPVGLPEILAEKIAHFKTVARIIVGIKNLKIFAFGPRPQDFYACNAPIKPLYNIGVEVMENSELDLYDIYREAEGDSKIDSIAKDMKQELGEGNTYPDLLKRLAQYELALTRFMEQNLGSGKYGIFANKCWPSFEKYFRFVPCYVNSRLAQRGIPVACEVDIYGALSEYICQLASDFPATLLDINNTVPEDMINDNHDLKGAKLQDLFMGFHCGNTCTACMKNCTMKYQLIMNRLMEDPNQSPDITRGTLEGQIKPGEITFFRLQGTADCLLKSYVAEGNVLDIDPQSFGGIGIFAIPGFARFYRYVLIEKRFPHHGAVAFKHAGKTLYDAIKLLGIDDIQYPRQDTILYPNENPFD